jgi:hypothetical protein
MSQLSAGNGKSVIRSSSVLNKTFSMREDPRDVSDIAIELIVGECNPDGVFENPSFRILDKVPWEESPLSLLSTPVFGPMLALVVVFSTAHFCSHG